MISEFSFLSIGLKKGKPGNHKRSLYLGLQSSTTVDLLFDHYCNFLSTKTEINKNKLNLINLDVLEALKRQMCST